VTNAFGYDKPLARQQFYAAIFQIDKEAALENEKELVIVIMFMPVIFALNHAESDHRFVYPA